MARFCQQCGKLNAADVCPTCAGRNHTPDRDRERQQRRVLKRLIKQGLLPKGALREVLGP